jgi:hypothetical protein
MVKNLVFIHNNVEERELLQSCFKQDESMVMMYENRQTTLREVMEKITEVGVDIIKGITNLTLVFHPQDSILLPFFLNSHSHDKYLVVTNELVELIRKLNAITDTELIVDMLACDLNSYTFKEKMEELQTDLHINVRYSLDKTGNLTEPTELAEQDTQTQTQIQTQTVSINWILESDNIDVKDYYFNDKISQWNHVLYFQIYKYSKIEYELLYDINNDSTGVIAPIYTKDRHGNVINTELYYDTEHRSIKYNPSVVQTAGNFASGGFYNSSSLSNVVAAVKARAGYAVLYSNGTVFSWLYMNSTAVYNAPTEVTAAGSNVISLYSTLDKFIALREDGTLVVWGEFSWSEFSWRNLHYSRSNNKFKTVYTNQYTYVGLREDGSLQAWGSQWNVPSGVTGVVTLYSNDYAFVGLKSDGSLIGWGDANYGASIPAALQLSTAKVRYVCCNQGAFAALDASKTMTSWGSSSFGGAKAMNNIRMMKATHQGFVAVATDNRVITFTNFVNPTVQFTLADIVEIYTTYNAYAVVTSAGVMKARGSPFTSGTSMVKDLTGVEYVVLNFDAGVALKSDQSIETWGRDQAGGLHKNIQYAGWPIGSTFNLYTNPSTYKLYTVNSLSFAGINSNGNAGSWGLLPGAGFSPSISSYRLHDSRGFLVSPSKTFYYDYFNGFHVVGGSTQSGSSGSYMYFRNSTTDRSTYPATLYRTNIINQENGIGQHITLKSIYLPLTVELKDSAFRTNFESSDNYYYYLDVTQKNGNVALFQITKENTAVYRDDMKCDVELMLPNMVSTGKQLSVYLVNNSGGYTASIVSSYFGINETFPKTMTYSSSKQRWVVEGLPINLDSSMSKYVIVDDTATSSAMFDGLTISTITNTNSLGQSVSTSSSFLTLTMSEPSATYDHSSNTYLLFSDVSEVKSLVAGVSIEKTGTESFLYSSLYLNFVLPNMVNAASLLLPLRMYLVDASGNYDKATDPYYTLDYNTETSKWETETNVNIDSGSGSGTASKFIIIDDNEYDAIEFSDELYASVIDVSNNFGQSGRVRSLFLTISCELVEPKATRQNDTSNNYFLYMGLKGVVAKFIVTRSDNTEFLYNQVEIALGMPNIVEADSLSGSNNIRLYEVDENNGFVYDSSVYTAMVYDASTSQWKAEITMTERNGAVKRFIVVEDIVPTSILGGDPYVENVREHSVRMIHNHLQQVILYQSADSSCIVRGYIKKLEKQQIDTMYKYLNKREYSLRGNVLAPLIYLYKYLVNMEVEDKTTGKVIRIDAYHGTIEEFEENTAREEQGEKNSSIIHWERLNTKNGLYNINDKFYYPKKDNFNAYIIYLDHGNYMTVKVDNHWTELNNVKLYLPSREKVNGSLQTQEYTLVKGELV